MGKKQHSKDRLFITRTEWAAEWGGAKDRDIRIPFKRLPFYCCALTFSPFEDPVCTQEGHVFDIVNIVPYIQKHNRNPVSGAPLAVKDLTTLKFHKNSDGEYHCPVLNKVFTEFSHIVAVKPTGNVFSYEAIKELNVKPKNWKDLLTDEPFLREDLITIQDPNKLDVKVLSQFDHVKNDIKFDSEEMRKLQEDPAYYINLNEDTKRMLKDLGTEKAKEAANMGGGGGKAQLERAAAVAALKAKRNENNKESSEPAKSIVDAASAAIHGRSAAVAKTSTVEKNAARAAARLTENREPVNSHLVKSIYSSGVASRSFTSTGLDPVTKNEAQYVKSEKNPKKKGYVRLHTTHGDLNIELHCDLVPRACENFITHCENGYYNGVIFHRSIRNFMIQGGDPTGTGKGGSSIWGKPFKDEFTSKLTHSGRGIVSMANSGPHSNGSQFFILYKSAPHLNNKHTVFGGVVGGIEALSVMDKIAVDNDDRPLEEIKILKTSVFVNPYTEPNEEEKEEEEKKQVAADDDDDDSEEFGLWFSNTPVIKEGGVGKYLNNSNSGVAAVEDSIQVNDDVVGVKKRKVSSAKGVEFKNFSGW